MAARHLMKEAWRGSRESSWTVSRKPSSESAWTGMERQAAVTPASLVTSLGVSLDYWPIRGE